MGLKKLALFLRLMAGPAGADYPLTSTNFWTAYKDVPEVLIAHDLERLNTKLGYYLLSDAPIDKKAAVINALSWNYHGKQNSQLFLEILGQKYKTSDILEKINPEERFCLAYLTALDDYNHVAGAHHLACQARRRIPGSFTVAIVTELIEAQANIGGKTPLWNFVAPVLSDDKLKQDLRPPGRAIIYNYMALYKQ